MIRLLTYLGETLSLKDMAYRHGVSPTVLCNRLHNGWSLERALETPVKPYHTMQQALAAYLEKQEGYHEH